MTCSFPQLMATAVFKITATLRLIFYNSSGNINESHRPKYLLKPIIQLGRNNCKIIISMYKYNIKHAPVKGNHLASMP